MTLLIESNIRTALERHQPGDPAPGNMCRAHYVDLAQLTPHPCLTHQAAAKALKRIQEQAQRRRVKYQIEAAAWKLQREAAKEADEAPE